MVEERIPGIYDIFWLSQKWESQVQVAVTFLRLSSILYPLYQHQNVRYQTPDTVLVLLVVLTCLGLTRCGIFAAHGLSKEQVPAFRARALALSKRLRHRGPDWSGCTMTDDTIMCHERLAIVGVGTFISRPSARLDTTWTLFLSFSDGVTALRERFNEC